MIDAASGGALIDKTPMEARTLIANMAANSQQFGDRRETPPLGELTKLESIPIYNNNWPPSLV